LREPDSGIVAVAELVQHTVIAAKLIANGHGMVAARAISVRMFHVVDGMEVETDVQIGVGRLTPI
jgi:hypothetical protein